MSRPKVAFICVYNSCRSQIAEALRKYLATETFESYSAGTEIKPQINQGAVRLMKQIHRLVDYATVYLNARVIFTFRNEMEVNTEI